MRTLDAGRRPVKPEAAQGSARMVITGAAGFLGSHLVDRFLAEGCEVVGVDNFVTGTRENLAHLEREPRFHLIEQDICEPLRIESKVAGVLHFASPASPADYNALPLETLLAGGPGTRNALELALRHGARFLLASTSEVYGDPAVHPQTEDYRGNVNPVGPRSVYDEAKRYAEAMTMAYHRVHSLDTRIARIFNTYGPRMRPADGRVVPNFITQGLRGAAMTIHGTGEQTRSFCHVDDQVEGIARLFQSGPVDPVNIGNPDEVTILELADIVGRETGNRAASVFRPLPPGDPAVRRPDISVARRELGWRPTIGLREGVRRTIPYFREMLAMHESLNGE